MTPMAHFRWVIVCVLMLLAAIAELWVLYTLLRQGLPTSDPTPACLVLIAMGIFGLLSATVWRDPSARRLNRTIDMYSERGWPRISQLLRFCLALERSSLFRWSAMVGSVFMIVLGAVVILMSRK